MLTRWLLAGATLASPEVMAEYQREKEKSGSRSAEV
jgi:hypothetical protein